MLATNISTATQKVRSNCETRRPGDENGTGTTNRDVGVD